jgi:hypothetical protein
VNSRVPVQRNEGERGFALLLVFLLAAGIAITLYMEMPRVAFESQRVREQMLVDRGQEYERGIQLFYRKFRRYPAKLDDLENTNNIRFLRRRYKDPMTGKDEWRMIHVGAGGFLTDSLVQKPPQQGQPGQPGQATLASQLGQTGPGGPAGQNQQAGLLGQAGQASGQTGQFGQTGQPGQTGQAGQADPNAPAPNQNGVAPGGGGINFAVARRPSDRVPGGLPGQGGAAPGTGDPNDPNHQQQPTDPSQQQPQYPGQIQNPPIAGQQFGLPGQTQLPGQPYPGQQYQQYAGQPGQPGQPGVYVNPQGVAMPQGVSPQPGQPYPNAYNPGQPPGSLAQGNFNQPGQNPALGAIQQALMSPRPATTNSGFSGGNGIAAGGGTWIAGVATTFKGTGIKIVNERHKYQEWEFVYDPKNDKNVTGVNPGQNAPGPQAPQNLPGGSSPSFGSSSNSGSSFGSSGTPGASTGTGTTSTTSTQPQQ